MYLIVMVMLQTGQYKIVSDQMLYATMDICEVARPTLMEKLEETKPSEDATVVSKCTMLSFEVDKSKVTL